MSSPLDAQGIKYVQRTIGSFLYYARAIDNTILPALNEIALAQAKPTENTLHKIQMLLDYMNTFPDAKIRFLASDMKLNVDSDAAYLVAPKAKSRVSGYYYMSDNSQPPKLNGPVLVECKLLKHVVTSAAEAETAGLFYNGQTTIELKNMLKALGHPQKAVPIKTDNATAASFVKDTLKMKRSKAWDVRYHWLSEQQNKQNINIYWDAGNNNIADYHSKHHSPSHHQNVRETYILKNFHLTKDNENTMNRRNVHARVCFYPGISSQRRNVPGTHQRSNYRWQNTLKYSTPHKFTS